MKHSIELDGFENQKIEAQIGGVGGPKLFINNQLAPKKKRNRLILLKNDGSESIASWKHNCLGLDAPSLIVDGKEFKLLEPLAWYIKAWCLIPIFLLFIGGLVGGLFGMSACSINFIIFRSSMKTFMKLFLTFIVSLLSVILFLLVSSILLEMMQ